VSDNTQPSFSLAHWLHLARAAHASDLHLSAGQPPRVRVHGHLHALRPEPLSASHATVLREEALRAGNVTASHADLDFALHWPSLGRYRVNAFEHLHGPGLVMRLLPEAVPPLSTLGVPAAVLSWLDAHGGLILITGATGSGKSTTLAALVQHLNHTRDGHILTLEDPIEFVHTSARCHIHQREIGRHTASFATGLRAALREDPDVILVGELRDLDTIRLALTAAETGHLVLGTLHTRSAAQTVSRLVDVFSPADQAQIRNQLSLSLLGVVAQQLLPSSTGERVAAHEVLCCTPAVRHLIREDKLSHIENAIQTGASHGMQTLQQAIQQLGTAGRLAATSAAPPPVPAGSQNQFPLHSTSGSGAL
jgi:twitching motility protein PilT